jgi:hypothetical protein
MVFTGVLAALALASVCALVLSGASGRTELQQKVDWQALLTANPGMTPEEAQQQAQLMEEGSITVDPNSENPAADFYANSDADIGDNDDVEDAGPGNHLGGWCDRLPCRCSNSPLPCAFRAPEPAVVARLA